MKSTDLPRLPGRSSAEQANPPELPSGPLPVFRRMSLSGRSFQPSQHFEHLHISGILGRPEISPTSSGSPKPASDGLRFFRKIGERRRIPERPDRLFRDLGTSFRVRKTGMRELHRLPFQLQEQEPISEKRHFGRQSQGKAGRILPQKFPGPEDIFDPLISHSRRSPTPEIPRTSAQDSPMQSEKKGSRRKRGVLQENKTAAFTNASMKFRSSTH